MKHQILIILSVFAFTVVQAQEKSKTIVETTFKVEGVCEMCKERIEESALRAKGVKLAEWDKKSQKLKVVYNSKKTEEKEIHKAIANQGHETSLIPADSSAYRLLPGCCRYKDGAECEHH